MTRMLLTCALCSITACATDADPGGLALAVDGDRLSGTFSDGAARIAFEGRPGAVRYLDGDGNALLVSLTTDAVPDGWIVDHDAVPDAQRRTRLASLGLFDDLAGALADATLDPAVAPLRDELVELAHAATPVEHDQLAAAATTSRTFYFSGVCPRIAEVDIFHNANGSGPFSFAWYESGRSTPSVYTAFTAPAYGYAFAYLEGWRVTKVRMSSSHWGHSWVESSYCL